MERPRTIYSLLSSAACVLIALAVVWRLAIGPIPSLVVAALWATLVVGFVVGVYATGIKRVEDEHQRRVAERRRKNGLPNS